MSEDSHTLILWGAGATATLGMRTTDQQGKFLKILAYSETKGSSEQSLSERVDRAIGEKNSIWVTPLKELLQILGDGNKIEQTTHITSEQLSAMSHNWDVIAAHSTSLEDRILKMRSLYDWLALKSIISMLLLEGSPNQLSTNFLTDLLNVLDIHNHSGHGFRTDKDQFIDPVRITGARNALKLLLHTMFFIDWHRLPSKEKKRRHLESHYQFALALGKRVQKYGKLLAGTHDCQDSKFYLGDVSFACLNFDPIAVWVQWIANRKLNQSPIVPHIGSPPYRLQIYHDLGHSVPSVRIGSKRRGLPRLAMTESAVQRINDPDHGATDRIRLSKFLFPHGCINWRECPDCGKLSSFLSDSWEIDSPTLFPVPPLKGFAKQIEIRLRLNKEREEFRQGAVDARACVHCGTLTYLHHTQIVLQSNFKSNPPPFIEEIQRDLRVVVQNSNHIIFMGYSIPPDDVDYRAFFATRRQRDSSKKVKCSLVIGKCKKLRRWLNPNDLSDINKLKLKPHHRRTLEATQSLFGKDNVRFYGGGIPQVFSDETMTSSSAVDQLLRWESTE